MIDVEGCTHSNSKRKKKETETEITFSQAAVFECGAPGTHCGKLSTICYANAMV